jgi:hypothetical protein
MLLKKRKGYSYNLKGYKIEHPQHDFSQICFKLNILLPSNSLL